MSRTRHHKEQKNRHNGHDLWSRRMGGMLSYCSYNKLLTRRKERHDEQQIIKEELGEITREYPTPS